LENPPDATVLGLDNVPLELPVAGPASRALAAFLDYLIVGIVVFLWGGACLALFAVRRGLQWWALAAFLVGLFVIEYGYFATVEILRGGQTFGKWAVGLRVVTREAARPGTAAFLIRNAVRSVDLIIGVPLMVLDDLARRLGDRLAGTVVVHVEASRRGAVVLPRAPRGWSAQEVALLESFLWRAPEMEPWRAEHLARQLLDCIRHDDPDLAARVDPARNPVEALGDLVRTAEA